MAGTVKHARLETPKARKERLKRGRQPHWQALIEGKVHLGWQCWKGESAGRWVLRRYIGSGKYRTATLGLADDAGPANGVQVLDYEQAKAKAGAMIETPGTSKITRITVRKALDLYFEHKRHKGQPIRDAVSRANVHILPRLGDLVVAELDATTLEKWLATMAAQPAQKRPKAGKPQFRQAAKSNDGIRARRATANRTLTILKAALNYAFDKKHVSNRDARGRRLEPFKKVETPRVRYLTVAEAERLINACDPDFRPLVRAALETGCRYSELTRLVVSDFNPDSGTVHIRETKTGNPRHVTLTPEGAGFFRQICAGRDGTEPIFRRADGTMWDKSDQGRPIRAASARARITPAINFHALRHTWASLAVMNKMPLMVVAKHLGHVDTTMVEKHYGHLAPSYITEAIHAGAPRFAGADMPSSVVPMPAGKSKRKKL